MAIAAQTEDVDPGLLELVQEEEAASVAERGLLSQGPEAPPVELPRGVVEVAPGGRGRRAPAVPGGGSRPGACPLGASVGAGAAFSAHSQVILGVVLTGHQEGQGVIDLEADSGVPDAGLWGRLIPKARGVEAQ